MLRLLELFTFFRVIFFGYRGVVGFMCLGFGWWLFNTQSSGYRLKHVGRCAIGCGYV